MVAWSVEADKGGSWGCGLWVGWSVFEKQALKTTPLKEVGG